MWHALQKIVAADCIVMMQAANTGLTGGSTPDGEDYDRPIVLINTLLLNQVQLIKNGEQVVCLPGATFDELERKLKPLNREPHSVIGSSCIGATVLGGICNNSGGALVRRGPAYTELALYAQLKSDGTLELVSYLDINLGVNSEQILTNLERADYKENDIVRSNAPRQMSVMRRMCAKLMQILPRVLMLILRACMRHQAPPVRFVYLQCAWILF